MRGRRAAAAVVAALMVGSVLAGLPSASAQAPDSTRAPASSPALDGWRVERSGPEEHVVRWTSPRRLPVRSSRPEIVDSAGRPLGVTRLVAGGHGVEVRVTGPVPDAATLDVVLAGDRLDEPGADRPAAERHEAPAIAPRTRLADDPGAPGPADVVTSRYRLEPIRLRGMPEPVEMVGQVVEPAPGSVAGPKPLVLFLHGRHEWCYSPRGRDAPDDWPCRGAAREVPSERGYLYLQRLLASHGYATVSIRANGINAQDWRLPDGGAAARADLVAAHLRHWGSLAAERDIDLSRTVLVGHSRGGEGVDRFALRPEPAGLHVTGQVLLAPTNFGDQRAAYVPTVTVLPYCDGDVSDLQGQRYVDTARELAPDDPALRSSVLLMGANHNYFNTEWTPGISAAPSFDDWGGRPKQYCGARHPQRLSAAQQRDAASVLVSGAVRLFAEGDEASLALFDGSPVTTETLAPAMAWSAALAGDRDTRYPGSDLRAVGGPAGRVRTCRAVVERSPTACGRGAWESTPSWPEGERMLPTVDDLEVAWRGSGTAATLELDRPLDLRDRRLQMRVIHDPRREAARFTLRAVDGSGHSAELSGSATLRRLPGGSDNARRWGRAVTFDPPSDATDFDPSDVRSLVLASGTGRARIWVRDLASVGPSVLAVPTRRPATLSVGTVKVPEGDGPGRGVAQVPWRVTGDVEPGARFRAVVRGSRKTTAVDIVVPPGVTSGTVPVRFSRNDTHDDRRRVFEVSAYAISGANVEDRKSVV